MRELYIVPLAAERVPLAYPLIQILHPTMSLDAWQSRAHAVLASPPTRPAGIVTLQDPRGLIVGLFVFHVDFQADDGPALVAEDFIAADIVGQESVARRLADALEGVARDYRCRTLHTAIACAGGSNARRIIDLMARLGHRVESFHLCKPVEAAG